VMDEWTWTRMVAALDGLGALNAQAQLDHDLVRVHRETLWEILKLTGADTSDFQSCPPQGVCTPDIPARALNEVVELKARFNRLEQFVIWVAESGHHGFQYEAYPGARYNDMVDAAKEALDDA
jgi:hypothetical protein